MASPIGTDLSCLDDLDEMMTEIEGPLVVLQATYRRVTTSRGEVPGCPDLGKDIGELLSKGMTPAQLSAVPGDLKQEAIKDECLLDASVVMTQPASGELRLAIRGQTAEGPFDLTVGAADAKTKILTSEAP